MSEVRSVHVTVGLRWMGTIGLGSRRHICLGHFLDIVRRGLVFSACVWGIDGLICMMVCILQGSDDSPWEYNGGQSALQTGGAVEKSPCDL